MLSQVIRHATEPLKPLRELNPEVPDGLQQVVNFLLAKDPAQRYATPERAAKALQIFLPIEPVAPKVPEVQAVAKPNPKPPSPTAAGAEIPVGRLVTGKVEKAPPAKKDEPKPPPLKKDEVKAPPAPAATAEFDVELVAIPFPPTGKPKKPGDQRGLLDMDRRDFIMFGSGIVGALITVLATAGLVSLVRRKPPKEDEKPPE
jgi:serine/threonine-protein kinase